MKILKKILLGLLFSASAFAFAQATSEGAKQMLEQQAASILGELKQNSAQYSGNPSAFARFVDTQVAPYLAFDRMAEIALGRHLQEVRAAGKFDAFRDAFRQLLVRVYSKSWTQYTNGTLSVIGQPTVDKYNRARVRAQVKDNAGKTEQIEFALWYDNGAWKVYDATFANISLVSGYRNTFDSEIQRGGIDALIGKMQTME